MIGFQVHLDDMEVNILPATGLGDSISNYVKTETHPCSATIQRL